MIVGVFLFAVGLQLVSLLLRQVAIPVGASLLAMECQTTLVCGCTYPLFR